MFDYVALLCDRSDPESSALLEDMDERYRSFEAVDLELQGGALALKVWSRTGGGSALGCLEFSDRTGLVLGQLFRSQVSGQAGQVESFGHADAAAVAATGGHCLLGSFWGRYVAFAAAKDRRALHVVRDPTGTLPCYRYALGSARLFFSDVALVVALPGFRALVDYDYLAINALVPQFQKSITGLEGVSEVLPGEVLTIDRSGEAKALAWNPYAIAAGEPVTGPEEAERLLLETTIHATSCLASGQRRPLMSVGGLDSSIVLACLAQVHGKDGVTAANFCTATPKGDERRYGQAAAAFAGTAFEHRHLDPSKVDLAGMIRIAPQVNPMPMFDCTSPAGGVYDLARDLGADALFYGVGGDNIFFQMPHILSALDYGRVGLGTAALPRVIFDAARYGRSTVWKTLGAMVREKLRPSNPFDLVTRLVAPSNRWPFLGKALMDVGPQLDRLHPLLLPDRAVPPGKCAHILSSAFLAIPYYDHWRPDYRIERICPLLSQPVIEACLRIPTWEFTSGGVDRALARRAFRNILAPEVLHRTSKCTPDDLYEEVYARNRLYVREFLLDGDLVENGILDRSALEKLLKGMPPREIGPGVALEFFSWEMWVQSTKNSNRSPLLH